MTIDFNWAIIIAVLVGLYSFILGNLECRWLFSLPPFERTKEIEATAKEGSEKDKENL